MTRGGDGLSVFTKAGEITVPGVKVDVVDTIGAGDTVHGALLDFLGNETILTRRDLNDMGKRDWEAALGFAARAAAITVSRPGADPPWASEAPRD